MPSRTIRCPSCRASFADGAAFDIVVPYKAASQNEVASIAEDGTIRLGPGDAGNPSSFGTPELICASCGHQWKTTRSWA